MKSTRKQSTINQGSTNHNKSRNLREKGKFAPLEEKHKTHEELYEIDENPSSTSQFDSKIGRIRV